MKKYLKPELLLIPATLLGLASIANIPGYSKFYTQGRLDLRNMTMREQRDFWRATYRVQGYGSISALLLVAYLSNE
jgi:hypothetical protein|tara:strand:- start:916 stop:1143 length:228 start_codon:yes stop_codon:yes gene_type:complete